MDMPRCATCKHFKPEDPGDPPLLDRPSEFMGLCSRIRAAHKFDDDSYEMREKFDRWDKSTTDEQRAAFDAELRRLAAEEKAVAKDASNYMAVVRVDPTFGCVLHEPKPEPVPCAMCGATIGVLEQDIGHRCKETPK